MEYTLRAWMTLFVLLNVTLSTVSALECSRDNNQTTCDDIDECSTGNHTCQVFENCINTRGSFRCEPKLTCPRGHQLDATRGRCVDINECITGNHTCQVFQKCINRPGWFRCINICEIGYRFNYTSGQCFDIDECSAGTHTCLPFQKCVNYPGSFRCDVKTCPPGYQLDVTSGQCLDINECASWRHPVCTIAGETCYNTAGSYECACRSGYTRDGILNNCLDVDECSTATHNCSVSEDCINEPGSFGCEPKTCPPGHQLNYTSGQCIDNGSDTTHADHQQSNGTLTATTLSHPTSGNSSYLMTGNEPAGSATTSAVSPLTVSLAVFSVFVSVAFIVVSALFYRSRTRTKSATLNSGYEKVIISDEDAAAENPAPYETIRVDADADYELMQSVCSHSSEPDATASDYEPVVFRTDNVQLEPANPVDVALCLDCICVEPQHYDNRPTFISE